MTTKKEKDYMPETKDKKNKDTEKASFTPSDIELTQKIDVDHEKVIGENKKKISIPNLEQEQKKTTSSLTGKSIFSRKRITDDYVKSSTILSTIASIPPLKDRLELRDVNDDYELKNQFASGAQGIIRTAFDKSLKRDIVVKSLKIEEVEEHARLDENSFVSEARIMAQLDHPSIIPLYGLHCGTKNKLHLAMKHIHGKTLKKYFQDIVTLYERDGIENFDERHSMSSRIEYLIKVCEAVDYAHNKGVIHRDLKPENIMIGNYGEVYVMDWGLACLAEADAHNKSELVGTPCYIAPELIRGEPCSPQSDIFSLGIILFEIITLQKAVPGKTVNEVLKNIIHSKYRPFKHRFLKGKPSADLKSIVAKAICDPLTQRYKSAKDMAADLKLFLMNEETRARPDNIFRKCIRAMINHKLITSIVILSMLLALAASTIHSLRSQNALMKEQEIREAMLTSFQARFAQRASKMERIFFYFKTQLANLAYRAGHLLSGKAVASERIYSFDDFAKPSTVPTDYAYSPFYSIKLSLDCAIFIPGPNVKMTDKQSRRIFPLQAMFKHYIFTSDPKFKNKTKSSVKKIILNAGAPLSWVSIGLKNGTMFSSPGTSCYSKNFDPRKRPWYKKALTQKNSIIWSEPYKCAVSSKILIACIKCVYDKENNFQGVVSMDIRLDYIKESVFSNHKNGLKEYLLDRKGRILLSSDFHDKTARTDYKKATLIKKNFPFLKEFRKALEQQLVQFELTRYNTKYIFALYRFPLGYYYIQQISEKRLRKNWEKNVSYKNK